MFLNLFFCSTFLHGILGLCVLGLMPLLFPSYVMCSKFIQNAVLMFCFFFLDCFCIFEHLKGFKLLPATVIVEGKLARFLLSFTWWIQSCLWTPDSLVSASTGSVALHPSFMVYSSAAAKAEPLQPLLRVTSFCR